MEKIPGVTYVAVKPAAEAAHVMWLENQVPYPYKSYMGPREDRIWYYTRLVRKSGRVLQEFAFNPGYESVAMEFKLRFG